ncbi:MAG: hypothetical protein LBS59_07080 [Puniceicoccales bacterium]|nr:hypothetical protein [Puniceicoccales bacterium]
MARENRLREVLAKAGVKVLQPKQIERDGAKWKVVNPGDAELTREFPEKGDNTCYTSCLLRIKLLRGEKLEGWQIYKALHSAIQRRGYDEKVPWKRKTSERKEDKDEEGETKQRVANYQAQLEALAPGQTQYHFPCYFDAYRLGLWNPQKPAEMLLRIDHTAKPARNRDGSDIPALVAPRELVIAETRALIESAAKQFPKLAGEADYILHGPGGKAYASYDPQLRKQYGLREGGAGDWLGILGQKVPRFDNRIIAKCALMPRFNVCKAEIRRDAAGKPYPDSLLVSEVTFLLKLKNTQVTPDDKAIRKLTAEEIRSIFDDPKREAEKFSFTEKQWKKKCLALGVQPAPGYEKIDAPKTGGRSRFCRPALKILRELILSGDSPLTLHTRELKKIAGNRNPQKSLVESDLYFLKQMGDSWENLYIPDQQHDALLRLREEAGRDAAIRALIGSVNAPIVRHRLETFWKRLVALDQKFGTPAEVVLEFVREDFMGEKAKIKLREFQKDREKARKEAREQADKAGATGRAAALKYELLKQQGGICLYTDDGLGATSLDELEIEHIVPRGQGGPDAVVNYVVTKRATNDIKGDRTPHQWLAANGAVSWDAYVKRVEKCATAIGRKKVLLLTSPDAPELVSRYTALAETAWIAKLSQTLVALYFGWPINSQTGERRITIVSGGVIARVRRQYKLNSILAPCPADEDPREWEEKCDKNRSDKRHHALDAMVLSFIPGWVRDKNKAGFFRLPNGVTRVTFKDAIGKVIPAPLAYEKPVLADTAYGLRENPDGGKKVIIQRVMLRALSQKQVAPGKTVFDLDYLRKQTEDILDLQIRRQISNFVQEDITYADWTKYCDEICLRRRDGTDGARIKRVTVAVGEPAEYKEMSKDGTGIYRKAKKSHCGQYVFYDTNDKVGVRPVYAFESPYQVRNSLTEKGFKPVAFLQSGCLIEIKAQVAHAVHPLPPGVYQLNTIIVRSRQVKLTTQEGITYKPKPKEGERVIPKYPLEELLKAGMRRINNKKSS